MNFKKLTALGMGLVLTASVLAGCGSSDSKNTSADVNNTSGDGAAATESTDIKSPNVQGVCIWFCLD